MAGIPEGFHRVNFNCPDDLFAELQDLAEDRGCAMSHLLLDAVRRLLALPKAPVLDEAAVKADINKLREMREGLRGQVVEQYIARIEVTPAKVEEDELAGMDPRLL